jgi:hypothetical protein
MSDRQAGAASPRRQPEDMSGKNIDDAFREINELCECWDNSLTVKNLAVAERYIKGEAEFGLVVKWQPNSYVSEEFVAIFERKFSVGGSFHRTFGHISRSLIDHVVPYSEHLLRCGYGDEQLVFVGDINTVETPYGVVPSTVRLQSSNEFDSLCRGALYTANAASSKIDSIRTYWERCVVRGSVWPLATTSATARRSRAHRKL